MTLPDGGAGLTVDDARRTRGRALPARLSGVLAAQPAVQRAARRPKPDQARRRRSTSADAHRAARRRRGAPPATTVASTRRPGDGCARATPATAVHGAAGAVRRPPATLAAAKIAAHDAIVRPGSTRPPASAGERRHGAGRRPRQGTSSPWRDAERAVRRVRTPSAISTAAADEAEDQLQRPESSSERSRARGARGGVRARRRSRSRPRSRARPRRPPRAASSGSGTATSRPSCRATRKPSPKPIDQRLHRRTLSRRCRRTMSCRRTCRPTRSRMTTNRGGGRGRRLDSFFSFCLASCLSAPDFADASDLALALGRAVVGVVEARALEVHGDRVEDALDRRAARLAGRGHGRVGDLLHHLEQVPVLAAVLVDRHGRAARSAARLRAPHAERRRDHGQDRGAVQAPRIRSSPPRRSTAGSPTPTTTGTTACCSSRTSSRSGGSR